MLNTARTLYDKLWDAHVVRQEPDGSSLLYIDRHLLESDIRQNALDTLKDVEFVPEWGKNRINAMLETRPA